MLRDIALVVVLTLAALAAGILMVPTEREQWTMLVRDERNTEALRLLEDQYRDGERQPDAMLHLYKLSMAAANIGQATAVVEEFAAQHPADVYAQALLARHYGDIQNKPAEIRALERLFDMTPSPDGAQKLLRLYRVWGEPAQERQFLDRLLRDGSIAANDAERLGLMLAATGDFIGARRALAAFDRLAPPKDRPLGRLALLDVMLRLGETKDALVMAEAWMSQWSRTPQPDTPAQDNVPLSRFVEVLAQTSPSDARRIVCALPGPTRLALGALNPAAFTCTGVAAQAPVDTSADAVGAVADTKGMSSDRSTQ